MKKYTLEYGEPQRTLTYQYVEGGVTRNGFIYTTTRRRYQRPLPRVRVTLKSGGETEGAAMAPRSTN